VVCAVVVAGLSLIVEPVSLVVLAALAWLWFARRQRAQRKHEGLRVLR
jgi:cytochrome c-type biogenesis protein CcmH/NrfF